MNEPLLIIVQVQNNGGKLYFYPRNVIAIDFCELLDQKTLTQSNIEKLKSMGFKIEIHGEKSNEK